MAFPSFVGRWTLNVGRWALAAFAAILLSSCVSPHKTYHAPDDAKVKAATRDLTVKVSKARDTAAKARQATVEAQQLLAQSINISTTVKALLEKLIVQLPAYNGPLREITVNVDDLIAKNSELENKVKEVVAWNTQLAVQLAEAEKARNTLQIEQNNYAGGAAGLAESATAEREDKIKVQKKLLWYRVRFWGAWVALGGAVLGWIVFGLFKVGIKTGVKSIIP